jgi:hypothetical protein
MDLLFIGNKNSNFFSCKKCNFLKGKEGLLEAESTIQKECFFEVKPMASAKV